MKYIKSQVNNRQFLAFMPDSIEDFDPEAARALAAGGAWFLPVQANPANGMVLADITGLRSLADAEDALPEYPDQALDAAGERVNAGHCVMLLKDVVFLTPEGGLRLIDLPYRCPAQGSIIELRGLWNAPPEAQDLFRELLAQMDGWTDIAPTAGPAIQVMTEPERVPGAGEAVKAEPVVEAVGAAEPVAEVVEPEPVPDPFEALAGDVAEACKPEPVYAPETVEEAVEPEPVYAPEPVEEAVEPEPVYAPEPVEEVVEPEPVYAPEAVYSPEPETVAEAVESAPAQEPEPAPVLDWNKRLDIGLSSFFGGEDEPAPDPFGRAEETPEPDRYEAAEPTAPEPVSDPFGRVEAAVAPDPFAFEPVEDAPDPAPAPFGRVEATAEPDPDPFELVEPEPDFEPAEASEPERPADGDIFGELSGGPSRSDGGESMLDIFNAAGDSGEREAPAPGPRPFMVRRPSAGKPPEEAPAPADPFADFGREADKPKPPKPRIGLFGKKKKRRSSFDDAFNGEDLEEEAAVDEVLYLSPKKKRTRGALRISREGRVIIGRSGEQADIAIGKRHVSERHAAIQYEHGEYYLTDLDSTNGTYVDRVRLTPHDSRKIEPLSEISFGGEVFYAVFEEE